MSERKWGIVYKTSMWTIFVLLLVVLGFSNYQAQKISRHSSPGITLVRANTARLDLGEILVLQDAEERWVITFDSSHVDVSSSHVNPVDEVVPIRGVHENVAVATGWFGDDIVFTLRDDGAINVHFPHRWHVSWPKVS